MKPRRRFGQHFLEAAWAARLLDAAALSAADHVIEIGPGRGALTLPLASRVASVTAIEIDRDMVAALRARVPSNVRIIEGNVLDVTPDAFRGPAGTHRVRVVGNLPYNVSTPILFRLLELSRTMDSLQDATLMLQREVAERVASGPGSKAYGVLSIHVQLEAAITTLLTLPPGAFKPPPQVWSQVIRLTFRPPPVPLPDRQLFDVLVRSLFAQRRKTILNSLRPLAASRGLDGAAVLRVAGLDPGRRPETLHLSELAGLADALRLPGKPSVV
jgi:16S rRNA (adenine1518-N6/adenine1519-N6)-dimethyltransferase